MYFFHFHFLLAAARDVKQYHTDLAEDPLKRALYGEADVALLCKAWDIDSKLSPKIVLNFAIHKQNNVYRVGKTDVTPQLTPNSIRWHRKGV